MLKMKLHWQILIALGLAVVAGLLAGKEASIFGVLFYDIFNFVGTLFLNALKMIIVPLIVSSIIVGIAGVGGTVGLGRLGGRWGGLRRPEPRACPLPDGRGSEREPRPAVGGQARKIRQHDGTGDRSAYSNPLPSSHLPNPNWRCVHIPLKTAFATGMRRCRMAQRSEQSRRASEPATCQGQ